MRLYLCFIVHLKVWIKIHIIRNVKIFLYLGCDALLSGIMGRHFSETSIIRVDEVIIPIVRNCTLILLCLGTVHFSVCGFLVMTPCDLVRGYHSCLYSFKHGTCSFFLNVSRVQLKCDGTRWRTGGEVKGKLANGVGSQYPSHHLGTWCVQHYYCWCAHLGCQ